jgi:hypothetical protein
MTDPASLVAGLRAGLDRLEQQARAATPGEWLVSDANEDTEYQPFWEIANDAFYNPLTQPDDEWLAVELHTGREADARHIAAWSPARVLGLCAAIRTIIDGYAEALTAHRDPRWAEGLYCTCVSCTAQKRGLSSLAGVLTETEDR